MRRKLIEQVKATVCLSKGLSAGLTSVITGAIIDRLGYNSAYFVQTEVSLTSATTAEGTTMTLYHCNTTAAASFTASDTATYTMYTTPGVSALGTITGTGTSYQDTLTVDLAGFKRYIQVYLTLSAAKTITSAVTVTCILGDAVIEPAV